MGFSSRVSENASACNKSWRKVETSNREVLYTIYESVCKPLPTSLRITPPPTPPTTFYRSCRKSPADSVAAVARDGCYLIGETEVVSVEACRSVARLILFDRCRL